MLLGRENHVHRSLAHGKVPYCGCYFAGIPQGLLHVRAVLRKRKAHYHHCACVGKNRAMDICGVLGRNYQAKAVFAPFAHNVDEVAALVLRYFPRLVRNYPELYSAFVVFCAAHLLLYKREREKRHNGAGCLAWEGMQIKAYEPSCELVHAYAAHRGEKPPSCNNELPKAECCLERIVVISLAFFKQQLVHGKQ